ncbi:MAG: hypothetical protein LBD32_00615 [Cytophagales bacterium]|jgi:hypothetical protein|nr:hypothetical protein [Cytophagales bacterium]
MILTKFCLLPDNKKLTYLGVDVEHRFKTAPKYLKILLRGKEDVSEDLKKFQSDSFILTAIKCYRLSKKYDYIQCDLLRKNAMYDNFKKIYKHYYSSGKFYGQFGAEHVFLNNIYDENPTIFATEINKNEDSPVKNKVCSMMIYYINSCYVQIDTFYMEGESKFFRHQSFK